MANANVIQGLVPCSDNKGSNNIRPMIPVNSGSNQIDLFIGSPYVMQGGELYGLEQSGDENDDGRAYCGAIVKLYNASKREVLNLPAGVDGYADVTYKENQEYMITVQGTEFESPADNGKFYNLTSETREADDNGFDGAATSGFQLLGSSEASADKQFIVSGMVQTPGNVDETTGTLVRGRINPANWQAS